MLDNLKELVYNASIESKLEVKQTIYHIIEKGKGPYYENSSRPIPVPRMRRAHAGHPPALPLLPHGALRPVHPLPLLHSGGEAFTVCRGLPPLPGLHQGGGAGPGGQLPHRKEHAGRGPCRPAS